METRLRRVTEVVTGCTVGFFAAGETYCVVTGRSHGELSRFTATCSSGKLGQLC